jgi:DnaJ domain
VEREPSPYDVLGVSETATPRQIKQAYRRLVRQYHPDTAPEGKADERRVNDLTEAYEELSDPARREGYDEAVRLAREEREQGQAPFGESSDSETTVGPLDHYAEEPLLSALGRMLWRLLRAGVRQVPLVFRHGPRVVLVAGGLVLAVFISSWAIRSYSKFTAEGHYKESLPSSVSSNCEGRSGIGDHLPAGTSAVLDCVVGGVSVTYFDTEESYTVRYFARHLRQAQKLTTIRRGKAGSCARPGHVTAYRYRGEPAYPIGRVFCYRTKGVVHFEWIDDTTYAVAASPRSYRNVYRWWRKQAGPYGDIQNETARVKVR